MQTDTYNIESLKSDVLKELTDDILSYWIDNAQDHANGGFHGRIDHFGTVIPNEPKGAVLNARILWTFSAAYRIKQEKEYKECATRAFNYLDNFIDIDLGGVFWMLDHKGKPLQTKKQVYAQGFAIYGLVEYYMAFHDEKALEKAIELFCLLEKYSFDKDRNGYFEAYSREWELLEDLRLSDKDANEKKTMNTHLHILEAYTNLYRVWKDKLLEKQLRNLLEIFLDKIVDPSTNHLNLFFDENWVLKSDIISFGHDIEASWLMQEAAEVLGDEKLIKETKAIAVKIAGATLNEGVDLDGGLMYEGRGREIIDGDKHWWPQAEALVGFYNAYEVSGDEKFLNQVFRTWDYIKEKIVDSKNGEWFWRVNREGQVISGEDKVGPWKCPYHNGRACIEILTRIGN